MFLSEFDQEAHDNSLRAEGALQKEQEMYIELLKNGKTVEEIAAFYGKTVDEINAILQLEI